ncbi:histidine--tRNA ligase [Candidatus Beckwithbacteria bacterium]|nr:histidine--tRNA ligase [Candidatus Beckwithbacteria bacterium]
MKQNNLQTLKGFRDFLPEDKRVRDFVAAKVKQSCELFGFEPLETPTLEYASILLGKYGAEADKLVYQFKDRGGRDIALRYDQTVPTARLLAQYQGKLPNFFRRYQLQNVFRAEKPQKGRFREFTQCDFDIYGSTSPLADAEILACCFDIFQNLGFADTVITINDRQVLFQVLQAFTSVNVDIFSITQSIDKLDKLKPEEVVAELTAKGLEKTKAEQVLTEIQKASPSNNLKAIMVAAQNLGIPEQNLVFEPTLARGLDYYTGMIFEIKSKAYSSSLGGGGRYDNLIKQLGGIEIPAVGVGLGFDRIVELVKQNNFFESNKSSTQVFITIFNQDLQKYSLTICQQLRAQNISAELSLTTDNIGKQIKLANQKKIPYVVIVGDEEVAQNTVTLKNLSNGEQVTTTLEEAITKLKQ